MSLPQPARRCYATSATRISPALARPYGRVGSFAGAKLLRRKLLGADSRERCWVRWLALGFNAFVVELIDDRKVPQMA